jgi:hypothetical protein
MQKGDYGVCWTIKTRKGSVCIFYLLQYIKSRLCRVGRNQVYSLSRAAHTSAKISSTLLSAGICGNKQVRKLYVKKTGCSEFGFQHCFLNMCQFISSRKVWGTGGRGRHASPDQSLFAIVYSCLLLLLKLRGGDQCKGRN